MATWDLQMAADQTTVWSRAQLQDSLSKVNRTPPVLRHFAALTIFGHLTIEGRLRGMQVLSRSNHHIRQMK